LRDGSEPMNVELHIEELVLHGFAPSCRYRIGETVERELARLLAEQGVLDPSGHNVVLEQVDAGQFTMNANAKSEAIGAQIAQAIYSGMIEGISG
jgi:hypothetical protein